MSDTIVAKGSKSSFTPHPQGQFLAQCVDTRVGRRLDAKVIPEPNTGCLLWTGATNRRGYGIINVEGRSTLAHRVAWVLAHGAIPAGMLVLHRCDTPGCVNADSHLFLGSDAANVADKIAKGRQRAGNANATKTHCRNGHPFDASNTYMRPGGWRDCKTCRRIALARHHKNRSATNV